MSSLAKFSGLSLNSESGNTNEGGPRIVMVSEVSDSDLSSSSSEDEDQQQQPSGERPTPTPDSAVKDTPDYGNIQKLIKYMKAGNQTATTVSLSCLKDHDLEGQACQVAVMEAGGLDVLVNLLETRDAKCRAGALCVLERVTRGSSAARRRVTDLGAAPLLVAILAEPSRELRALAAETLANLARVRKARKIVRRHGGVPKLVDLLDVATHCLTTPRSELGDDECASLDLARAGTKALWSMSASCRNRDAMRKHGIVPLFARLLRTVHVDVAVPAMGTLQECASEPTIQLAVHTEGMITDIVHHLAGDCDELKMYCSLAIYKCCEDEAAREAVRAAGGLELLVAAATSAATAGTPVAHQAAPAEDGSAEATRPVIEEPAQETDPRLLGAITGALWKCSRGGGGGAKLVGAVEALVALLARRDDRVLANVSGALAECAKFAPGRVKLRDAGGIALLVGHLNSSHVPLLENVPLVLMECARDPDSMARIEKLDGVRLMWSLLKNESPRVQANACLALCPCIEKASDSAVQVRSFVGGLELIVSLLTSPHNSVLAAVCATIATIAKDRENLAIISDHGVVAKLAALVHTIDDRLRDSLAEAIAYCCDWTGNREEFGRLGAIEPLVGYLTSSDPRVHRSTALALFHLSFHPTNCVTMHQAGVVKFLLETVGSSDEELQEASAGCLCNIRKLALDTDKVKLCTQ